MQHKMQKLYPSFWARDIRFCHVRISRFRSLCEEWGRWALVGGSEEPVANPCGLGHVPDDMIRRGDLAKVEATIRTYWGNKQGATQDVNAIRALLQSPESARLGHV